MEKRPTARELHEMADEELLYRLMSDEHTTYMALHRSEARSRALLTWSIFSKANKNISNHAEKSKFSELPLDITPMIQENQLHTECLRPLAEAILHSGWQFNTDRWMTSTPEDARDFLESLAWRDQYWEQLNEKAQRKLNTIIDAYGRWWRNQARS